MIRSFMNDGLVIGMTEGMGAERQMIANLESSPTWPFF